MLNNKYRQVSIFATLAVMVGLAAITGQSAYAESNSVSSNILKISPVRRDIEIKPGERQTVQVTVTNLANTAITVHPVENDFIAGDEKGTPSLILDENEFAKTHSLKRFMQPIADVTIPANSSKTIDVVIVVPSTAQAGGYFGAIRFSPARPNSGGQVNLNASAASLVLLTVPGDTVEKLNLTDFYVQQNGKMGTRFEKPDKLELIARFENKGNVQVGPFGKITVKQGDKVVYETDFNNRNPRDMALPDSARRWEIPLENIGSFGRYTVLSTFTYGKTNQTTDIETSFWVIPKTVIILAIGGILAVIALIIGIWLFLRSYRRRILRRHGRSGGLGMRR